MVGLGYRGVNYDAMTQPTIVKLGCGEDGSSVDDLHSLALTETRYISPVLCIRNEGDVVGPGFAYYWFPICKYSAMMVNRV